jgi:hypothetical protein
VHQLTGPLAFVALDLPAQFAAGGQVQLVQPRFALAAQHPVDRRGTQAESIGDAGRSPPALAAQVQDPADHRPAGLPRRTPRP